MCGIAGYIDLKEGASEDHLRRMVSPLLKRGPDDEGVLVNGAAGLLHRRLSIIDVHGGRQPITNEDGSLALVCNGEVYDYQRLRGKLRTRGHSFRTESDSEVLLHLYEEKGADFLEEINGMFAFAILHLGDNTLFLARDRFGQKPLFYAQEGDRIAFASGPQALVALPWVSDELDLTGIHDYLEYQYVPEPRSVYRGIGKLPPHCYAVWKGGDMDMHSYWSPFVGDGDKEDVGYREAAMNLRTSLQSAVARRMVADVPVGMFLSGGMDSGLICALAQQCSEQPVRTFSIGFPEQKYDERHIAERIAHRLGTEHHCKEVNPGDFRYIQKIARRFEEPFADASMLPTALLSAFTRQHVKVALSGDGADELFGGYYRYRVMHIMQALSLCPRSLRRAVGRTLLSVLPAKKEERTLAGQLRRLIEISQSDGIERYLALISRFPTSLREQIYTPQMHNAVRNCRDVEVLERFVRPHRRFVDTIMEVDISTYLNNDILTKVDRASMAYGLEVRSPFLDPEVAESALQMPYRWKQSGRRRKCILATAFSDLLPSDIFERSKMGFGVPLARWFRQEWYEQTRELLLEGELARSGLFKRSGLMSLLEAHAAEKGDYSYGLFALLILELWMQTYNYSLP